MHEKVDTALVVAYGILRLPYELLLDERAFRRLGRLAIEDKHHEKPNTILSNEPIREDD